MYLEDKKITISSPNDAIRQGIGFLTENRKEEGLILDYSISENISLPSIDGFRKNGLIDTQAEKDFVELLMERLKVKAEGCDDIVSGLSGGKKPTEGRFSQNGSASAPKS